jgi:hypothetical protein
MGFTFGLIAFCFSSASLEINLNLPHDRDLAREFAFSTSD